MRNARWQCKALVHLPTTQKPSGDSPSAAISHNPPTPKLHFVLSNLHSQNNVQGWTPCPSSKLSPALAGSNLEPPPRTHPGLLPGEGERGLQVCLVQRCYQRGGAGKKRGVTDGDCTRDHSHVDLRQTSGVGFCLENMCAPSCCLVSQALYLLNNRNKIQTKIEASVISNSTLVQQTTKK